MNTVDDVVLELLEAVLAHVHDGQVPVDDSDSNVVTSALPYVVYYSNLGDDDTRRYSGRATRREVTFQITYVGGTREQAKWAGQRARGALADRRLWPEGPRMRLAESQRVLPDNDARQPDGGSLFYGADQYAVRAPIGA